MELIASHREIKAGVPIKSFTLEVEINFKQKAQVFRINNLSDLILCCCYYYQGDVNKIRYYLLQ